MAVVGLPHNFDVCVLMTEEHAKLFADGGTKLVTEREATDTIAISRDVVLHLMVEALLKKSSSR